MRRLASTSLLVLVASVLLLAPLSSAARPEGLSQLNRGVARLGGTVRGIGSSVLGKVQGFGTSLRGKVQGFGTSLFGRTSGATPGSKSALGAVSSSVTVTPTVKRNLAAARAEGTREMFSDLAGSQPLNSRQIAEKLRAAGLGERGVHAYSEETPDRGYVEYKLVRTGTTRGGQPTGYVRASWYDAKSDSNVVEFNGTNSSWVRRGSGNSGVALVVRNRNLRDKDGRLRVPAGTRIKVSREELGDDLRTTISRRTLTDDYQQRTTTKNASGRTEVFTMSIDRAKGIQKEERLRQKADGSSRKLERVYDGKTLRTSESGSRGRPYEPQVLDRAQAEPLLEKVREAEKNRAKSLREYKGRGWLWREVNGAGEGMGTVRAQGRGGELGAVVSGFVSPLGTRYGEVKQRLNGFGAVRVRGSKPVHVSTTRDTDPLPPLEELPEPPPLSAVTAAERRDTLRTERLINRVTPQDPGRFHIFIDPVAEDGAATRPLDEKYETDFGTPVAKAKRPVKVGVGAHELGHERYPLKWENHRARTKLWGQYESLSALSSPTEASVASLHAANMARSNERHSDETAGTVLARVRQLTHDHAMTPQATIDFLGRDALGKPLPQEQWNPHSTYDNLKERGRTMWQAYRREGKLQRLVSSAQRHASAAQQGRLKAHREPGEGLPAAMP